MTDAPLPIVQSTQRDGIVELGRGYPHPDALPVRRWAGASVAALRRYGPSVLMYGHNRGPGPLIEWLCARLAQTDAQAPGPAEVFVTAGASHALELVCTQLVRHTDTVLVQSPTYYLALRILADHAARLVPVPEDGSGVDIAATRELLARLRAQGHRVPLLYLVPTYGNPTGASLPPRRRAELVELAQHTGTVLVEDDTYRELCYDGTPPPSLYGLADGTGVVRIGSFAKSVAPGLRLGYLTGPDPLVAGLARRGYVDSGGGVNHATALTMAEFGGSGDYLAHLTEVRARYRRQRDALVAALRADLPTASFGVPDGGWFVWLGLSPELDATALLPVAEAAGVSYLDGARCAVDGTGRDRIRLAFSLLDPEWLGEGVRRLATVLDGAPSGTQAATGIMRSGDTG